LNTIQNPQGKKQYVFAEGQEACRKNIKKYFGVLQAPFAIV
jgi:hypothetical protein